jgi:TP901 family phage tail tape measure protein
MALAERADLVARLSLDDQFSSKLRRAQGALGQFGKGVGQLGAGIARIGAVAAGATAVALTGAVKAATDYEQAFSGVRKTLNATPAELEAISKQFREMARTMPIAAVEFARIGEAAGALGIPTKDVAEFSRVVALLGVTTNLSVDEAAEAFGILGNILKLSGAEYAKTAAALVALGNNGASTEAQIVEITKRFAAAGKQAGLTTPQILGFSSAIASVGVEPEAAGSSLSRLFNNATLAIGTNSKKLQGYIDVAGKGFVDLYKRDAAGALKLFLTELGKLDRFQASAALKKAGIINVRDINAILLLSQNMGLLNDQLAVSEEGYRANSALTKEAQQRFLTFASKVTVLKNNLIDLGIAIGTGMIPALGRAAEKLTAFLQKNEKELEAFGKQLGSAIDEINWEALFDGAKTFVSYLKTVYDLLNALPSQIKIAGAAFLGLNKLSGGLLGAGLSNIVGGLIGSVTRGLFSHLPVIGGVAAMPVRVTNWPLGGLGGGVGGGVATGGGISGLGKILLVGEALSLLGLVAGTNAEIAGNTKRQAEEVGSTAFDWLSDARTTTADIVSGLAATQDALAQLRTDPVSVGLNLGGAGDAVRKLEEIQRLAEAELRERRADNAMQIQSFGKVSQEVTGLKGPLLGIDSAVRAIDVRPQVHISPSNVNVSVRVNSTVTSTSVTTAKWESDRYYSTAPNQRPAI